jgi:hypothetical protein
MAQLMSCPDEQVRLHAGRAVAAAQDEWPVPVAAATAHSALTPLPGFAYGDAMASVVCFVATPTRLAVYDRRAHLAFSSLVLFLTIDPAAMAATCSLP